VQLARAPEYKGPSPNARILGVQVFYVYVLQSH